jgi:hypothetical protein
MTFLPMTLLAMPAAKPYPFTSCFMAPGYKTAFFPMAMFAGY